MSPALRSDTARKLPGVPALCARRLIVRKGLASSMNAQQQAALDTHVHCAVLANAGAGKTQVLVQRLLRILVVENVEPDRVVAITFTRAAAMEMRQRLHELIESILRGTEDPAPYLGSLPPTSYEPRLRRLLVQIGSTRISTFHSFCASLVRQYADVVGRSSDVRDADERLSSELCQEAVDAAMNHFLGAERLADPRVQAAFDSLSIGKVHEIVAGMTRSSAERRQMSSILAEPISAALERRRTAADGIRRQQARLVCMELLRHLHDFTDVREIEQLHHSLADLSDRVEGGDEALGELTSLLETWFNRDYTIKKTKLSKDSKGSPLPEAPDKALAEMADFARATWDDASERHQLMVTQGLALMSDRAARHYAEIKRRRNVIDFDDMIDDATKLLTDPGVSTMIRESVSYIMIDEFQDTDPTQYRLLELLAPALRDGRSGGPNVFLVGDDKQSIYGFRNADVRLFRRARRAIKGANSATEPADTGLRPLTQSYRMHQHLVEAINDICKHAFGAVAPPDEEDEVSFDVAYMELAAAIERETRQSLSSLRLLGVGDGDDDSDSEFEHLARHLAGMLAADSGVEVFERSVAHRPVRPGDIAVLVPSNKDKSKVAEALRRQSLPYTIYSGRSFFSRPEVADVRAALTAASDPQNDLATATAMRSPLLRVPDDDIVRASLRGRKSSLQDGLADLVASGTASDEAKAAMRFFVDLRTMISLRPLSEVITPMLEQCGWHQATSADARYRQMVVNIDKLIEICAKAEQDRSASLSDVLNAIAEPDRDLEAEGTVMSDDDAIHVMTIHASKGLEFPVVALAGLNTRSHDDTFVISQQIGPTMNVPDKIVLPSDALSTASLPVSMSCRANAIISRQRREAEQRRLLYVALTRAKAHLVICLPSGEQASRAKGLSRILVAATTHDGPWLRFDASSAEDAVDVAARAPVASPLTKPFAPIPPPAPLLVTASTLNRQTSSHATPVGRRIVGTESSSTEYGTAVHSALADLVRSASASSTDESIRRLVSIMKRHELDRERSKQAIDEVLAVLGSSLVQGHTEALASGVIEGTLMALRGETLVEGVLDVRLTSADGTVEVWDWKTNKVRSERQMQEVADSYRTQMETYAWLCMQALPDCHRVVTRLVFTKAALAGWARIDHEQLWHRADVSLFTGA
ncbi:MAG: hypothetical protein FGM33_05270 [Candidatus Kapabacteria bacterium]|nr:hypothetical protein [Candidatus Kapabacteria bacterium]